MPPDAPAGNLAPPPAHPPSRQRTVRTVLSWLVASCLLPGIVGACVLFALEYRNAEQQQERDTIQTARALMQAV
ncbi:hypothetical protein, partial [Noviherbaspirillum denitrificans]|uniref:hypothetical protein n=1 Tax=Noviherbaspirillum denitrificans TaxID=1968433 RepID=UPI00197CCCE3